MDAYDSLKFEIESGVGLDIDDERIIEILLNQMDEDACARALEELLSEDSEENDVSGTIYDPQVAPDVKFNGPYD